MKTSLSNAFYLLPLLLLAFTNCSEDTKRSKETNLDEFDHKVEVWLEEFNIPGAAVAIIENGELVLQKGYGFGDVENQVKVNEQTGFNVASISKTITAWGVMKLVEQGKLELDEPAETYLTRWSLPESEYDSKEVTIRRLLSHTAGLSLHGYLGYAPKDTLPSIEESLSGATNGSGDVHIRIKPGTRYSYSGGGYTLLQLIIEEVTEMNFEEYMQEEILNPLGMTNSSFSIDAKILKNSSKEYNQFEKEIDFELFTAKAAAGLHTTIEDFGKFALASIDTNNSYQKVLLTSTLELMNTAAPYSQNRYGLGHAIEMFNGDSIKMSGHSGSNDGWKALLKFNRDKADAFIVLTNSASGGSLMRQAHCDWMNWSQKASMGNCSIKSITPLLINTLKNKGIDSTVAKFKSVKEASPQTHYYRERDLNLFGYELLWNNQIKESIKVFEIVIEEYPYSYNAFDSYAEALLADGKRDEAIKNYTRSVQMNPRNDNAIEMLKKEGVKLDEIKVFATEEEMKALAGLYTNSLGDELNIDIEFSHGGLLLKDQGTNSALVPLGDNKFANPRQEGPLENALLVFNLTTDNDFELKMYGKHKLKRIDKNLIVTKDTWGQEIFVFPLNFAQDINYKGFEDVRFPRGWSNKDTSTFWSYAGAWSINIDTLLSQEELNEVWKLYFDGLMKDVNKINGAKLEKTAASFKRVNTSNSNAFYSGKLTVVNAFGTNELIQLNAKIEQLICFEKNRSYVLFKFSPAAYHEEVWKELDDIKLLDKLCVEEKH